MPVGGHAITEVCTVELTNEHARLFIGDQSVAESEPYRVEHVILFPPSRDSESDVIAEDSDGAAVVSLCWVSGNPTAAAVSTEHALDFFVGVTCVPIDFLRGQRTHWEYQYVLQWRDLYGAIGESDHTSSLGSVGVQLVEVVSDMRGAGDSALNERCEPISGNVQLHHLLLLVETVHIVAGVLPLSTKDLSAILVSLCLHLYGYRKSR